MIDLVAGLPENVSGNAPGWVGSHFACKIQANPVPVGIGKICFAPQPGLVDGQLFKNKSGSLHLDAPGIEIGAFKIHNRGGVDLRGKVDGKSGVVLSHKPGIMLGTDNEFQPHSGIKLDGAGNIRDRNCDLVEVHGGWLEGMERKAGGVYGANVILGRNKFFDCDRVLNFGHR
jgi:hypothetical protein